MKYLKFFEKLNVDVGMCFDGFQDIGFLYNDTLVNQNRVQIYPNMRNSILWVGHINKNTFNISEEIEDELVSSIGKAVELGFKLENIRFYNSNTGANNFIKISEFNEDGRLHEYSPTKNKSIREKLYTSITVDFENNYKGK